MNRRTLIYIYKYTYGTVKEMEVMIERRIVTYLGGGDCIATSLRVMRKLVRRSHEAQDG